MKKLDFISQDIAISLLVSQGVDLTLVQKQVGHKNLNMITQI